MGWGWWRRVRDVDGGEGVEFRSARGSSGGLRYSPDIEMSKPSHHWNCQSLPLPPFPPRTISLLRPPLAVLPTPVERSFSQRGASAFKMFDSCLSFSGSSGCGFITMRLYYQDFKTRSIGLSPRDLSFLPALPWALHINLSCGASWFHREIDRLFRIVSQCLSTNAGDYIYPLFLFSSNQISHTNSFPICRK